MKSKLNVLVIALAAGAGMLLAGCPPQGVVCQEGTERCGEGCADFTSDRRNCGGCGLACQAGQVCQNSECVCSPGAVSCGGKCVVLSTDPNNCGACGNACPTGGVCELNADGGAVCKLNCEVAGNTNCSGACANLQSDSMNCGACGQACLDGRVCKQGRCSYDAVMACRDFGQVVGVTYTDGGVFRGPRTNLGTTPAALGAFEDVLLVLDDTDNVLLQAGMDEFAPLVKADGGSNTVAVGAVPNQVVVRAPYVFVVNAASNTLQILQMDVVAPVVDAGTDAGFDAGFDAGVEVDAGTDGGLDDGGTAPPPEFIHDLNSGHPNGVNLATISEVNFGSGTFPEAVALVGNGAYVPLYGGFGAPLSVSQKIVRVDITDPVNPVVNKTWDLTMLDLGSFDGGEAIPRPITITSFGGKVYAALNNLKSDYITAAGPGRLAEIDPANDSIDEVDLGTACLNALGLASTTDALFVSCGGEVSYDQNYVATAVKANGVAMLQRTSPTGPLAVASMWTPCGTNTSCPIMLPGRLGAANGRVIVTDQGNGQVRLLVVQNGQLVEQPNVSPLQACAPTDANHFYSNVSDVLAIP